MGRLKLEIAGLALLGSLMICGFLGDANVIAQDGIHIPYGNSMTSKSWIMIFGIGIGVVVVLLVLNKFTNPEYRLHDWELNNTIVAYSSVYGCHLVKASGIHGMEGRDPYTVGNLPANLWFVDYDKDGNKLYIVDWYHRFDSPGGNNDVQHSLMKNDFKWQWLDGEDYDRYEIWPRGEDDNNNALADIVDGYEHNYIHEKGTPRPNAHPNVH